MKIKFRENLHMSASNKTMLAKINSIIEEYRLQGYKMTLRQLYYQLVSRDVIPNKVSEYEKIGNLLVKGRMCGIVDWDAIEDRIRVPRIPYSADGVDDALNDIAKQFRIDRQAGQPNYIELWVEKDALSNILYQKTAHYHINMMVNRGYSSCTAMFDAYNRLSNALKAGKQTINILYIGDHDPSGLDMIRDIRDRILEFLKNSGNLLNWWMREFEESSNDSEDIIVRYLNWLDDKLIVKPIALTTEQVRKYNPPPNPTKLKDPRSKWYLENFGHTSWEVDALTPPVLHQIIDDNIKSLLDERMWQECKDSEDSQKAELENHIGLKEKLETSIEMLYDLQETYKNLDVKMPSKFTTLLNNSIEKTVKNITI